jgi:hypothetical protein
MFYLLRINTVLCYHAFYSLSIFVTMLTESEDLLRTYYFGKNQAPPLVKKNLIIHRYLSEKILKLT